MDMTVNSQIEAATYSAGLLAVLPLSALYPSKQNVRTTPGTMPIHELAESIFTQGLLQNLVVTPKKGNRKAQTHAVVAGGRRYQALTMLAEQGRIPSDYPVSVIVIEDAARVIAVSLAENVAREAMHIADELAAILKLDKEGRAVENIANTLGISMLTARRRLKLVGVSSKLVDLLRSDEITLEQLMALAISDSHAEQERVWFGAGQYQRSPSQLRVALTHDEIDAGDNPLARFVGVDAYAAAGGAVRRDLFSDDNNGYLADADLLYRLCEERLEGEAQALRNAGWSWAEVRSRYDHSEFSRYGRLRPTDMPLSPEAAEELRMLREQAVALDAEYDALCDADDERADEVYEKLEAVTEQITSLEERSTKAWSPEQRAASGVVVYVNRDGTLALKEGLVLPNAMVRSNGDPAMVVKDQYGSVKEPKTRPTHADKLVRHLTAHRTAAVQAALAARPDVAFALVTATLVAGVFHAYAAENGLEIRGTQIDHKLTSAADDMESSRAWQELTAQREKWQAMVPATQAELLPWLMTLDWETFSALTAFCVAVHVNGVRDTEKHHAPIDALAGALTVDMADYWTPTSASYFGRISKAQMITVVTEAVSAEAAAPLAAMKKDAAAQAAERAMQGLRWTPEPMHPRKAG
ncbi:ParB-like nuclease [Cupriavidus basilensis OR16]|uniref:ParB-like nuclease n=1 Tax=Cupriavidus basilensis OR16 TaxID=1127483 RepID=H1RZZ9_9BURK|nr:ParB/RepB/Spo0J family partition protein [Cupriavidus basilensis]EHP44215.1 ParB-like nuclease [Cupriavidus basilensis OR16]